MNLTQFFLIKRILTTNMYVKYLLKNVQEKIPGRKKKPGDVTSAALLAAGSRAICRSHHVLLERNLQKL